MASNALTNLRSTDPSANRQTDAISRLVEPVCRAVMATPMMGAAPPPWNLLQPAAGFAQPAASTGLESAGWRVDALGFVHLGGVMSAPAGALAGATISTLPVGARPAKTRVFITTFGASLFVGPDGRIYSDSAFVGATLVSLEAIFQAEV